MLIYFQFKRKMAVVILKRIMGRVTFAFVFYFCYFSYSLSVSRSHNGHKQKWGFPEDGKEKERASEKYFILGMLLCSLSEQYLQIAKDLQTSFHSISIWHMCFSFYLITFLHTTYWFLIMGIHKDIIPCYIPQVHFNLEKIFHNLEQQFALATACHPR